MCIFMISKIYTLNAYRSCWKVYPFFKISAILIPFPLYARTSPVREKRPFLRVFLYEHGVHLSMACSCPPPRGGGGECILQQNKIVFSRLILQSYAFILGLYNSEQEWTILIGLFGHSLSQIGGGDKASDWGKWHLPPQHPASFMIMTNAYIQLLQEKQRKFTPVIMLSPMPSVRLLLK